MNQPFTDELISAYLDGELTAEEQAAVEQALLDSAENRQLFEELRALRGSLQSLPSHTLPADFSQRVIQRAERAMLREAEPLGARSRAVNSAAPTSSNSSAKSSSGETSKQEASHGAAIPDGDLSTRPTQWRGLVWAFAALAAALLVALYLPKIEMNSVAKVENPQRKKIVQDQNETPAKPGDLREGQLPEGVGSSGARQGGEVPGAAPVVISGDNEPKMKSNRLQEDKRPERAPDKLADGIAAKESPAAEKQRSADFNRDAAERVPSGKGLDEVQAKKVPAAPPSPGPGGPMVAAPVPGTAPTPADLAAGHNAARKSDGLAKSLKDQDAEEPAWYVVRLQTTREALESGAFDNALRRNNIQFNGVAAAAAPVKESEELRRQSRRLTQQASAEGVDVVFVEATMEQIQATLADLKADRSAFLGVASQLLTDEADRSLERGDVLRAKQLTQNDRRSNGEVGSNVARNRLGGEDKEGLAKMQALSPYADKFHSPDKPGEAKAAFGGGGGVGGGGAPARGVAPGVAPGAPAPAAPAGPAGRDEESANLGGYLAKSREDRAPSGLASRIAPPSFREYNGLEFRKSAQLALDSFEAAKSKQSEYAAPLEGAAKRAAEVVLAEKETAERKAAAKGNLADAKPAAAQPAYGALPPAGGAGRGGAKGEQEFEQLKREGGVATPERIRVLFVIRAVEQEAPAKPEK